LGGHCVDDAKTPTALRREVLTAATPQDVIARLPQAIAGQVAA